MKRRDFIIASGITGLGISLMPTAACNNTTKTENKKTSEPGQFQLPELGFGYQDLEPHIDAQTMEIHYSKHHAGYVKKLNKAIGDHPLKGKELNTILSQVSNTDADKNVLNNGGGHFNHSLYWNIMTPGGKNKPAGALANAINRDFGSYDNFLKAFSAAAAGVFGSGWAWMSVNSDRKLNISGTKNQENPLMSQVVSQPGMPVLGIDVWEHAYYLNYQNKRKEYISNFLEVINWDQVSKRYEAAM